nr:immunoglobulin heavy chain junction region [Mus musculus]
CARGRDWADFW